MLEFERMKRGEIAECAELAAQAFLDYEYFEIYIRDAERRLRFLRGMLEIEFKINFERSILMTAKRDGQLAGVAMLCPPEYRKPSSASYMLAGFWKLFLIGGNKNVSAWLEMEEQAGSCCHAQKDGAWYLSLLTVAPEQKGRGVGSALLQECLIPCAKARGGQLLTLFTNSQGNRLFYQKNGFREFDEKHFSYGDGTIGSWSYQMPLAKRGE